MSNSLPQPAPAQHAPLHAFTSVALLSALGMALGYARDAGLAAIFGASSLTDAFFVATIIPTIVSTVIMSGALAPALLPVFRARLDTRGHAWALANTLLSWGVVVLILIVALIFVAAPWLVAWLAPGLNVETAMLAVQLTRLAAPLLFLLGMSALMGALANGLNSFRLPALATVSVNGAAFLAILAFGRVIGIQSAVLGLTIGAFIQLLAQTIGLYRHGWRPSLLFDLRQTDVRETLRLFFPLIAFVALAQCVPIVERVFGSLFPAGELSLLAYAGKLFQIPGVVLSSSLAIVLYPHLIQAHIDSKRDATRTLWDQALAQAVRSSVFLTLPLALWFFWNAAPLVRLIFQRGQFSAQDAAETAHLLQFYTLAIVPAGIVLVLTRAFQAQRKMFLTLGVGVITFFVYVFAAVVGTRVFGLIGLPLAFFVSQFFAAIVYGGLMFRGGILRTLGRPNGMKLGAAGIVSTILLAGLAQVSASVVADGTLPVLALVLVGSLALLALVYLVTTVWLGIPEARSYFILARGYLRLAGIGGTP